MNLEADIMEFATNTRRQRPKDTKATATHARIQTSNTIRIILSSHTIAAICEHNVLSSGNVSYRPRTAVHSRDKVKI